MDNNTNSEKLNNTIKQVRDILEQYKDEEDIKEAYEDICKLAEKRNIK